MPSITTTAWRVSCAGPEWGRRSRGSSRRRSSRTSHRGPSAPTVTSVSRRRCTGRGGDPVAAGFFYGKTFLYTAGLMNLLVVLDVHDIARGDKS